MKKIVISILCVVVLAALYACSNGSSGEPDPGSDGEGQGITVNDIPFERVEVDKLPDGIKDKVKLNRETEGFEILQSGEVSYLIVYAGQRPTAGYSIEIMRIVDQEGVTQVTVNEKAPGKDTIVAQVITYPLDIAKLELGISANVELSFVNDDKG